MEDNHYEQLVDMIEDNADDEPLLKALLSREEKNLTPLEIATVSLNLGLTSFGVSNDHQEIIKSKIVEENQYVKDSTYNSILELCLLLPGYSSSNFLAALCIVNTKKISSGLLAILCYNLPSLLLIFLLSPLMNIIKYEIRPQMSNYDPDVKYFSIHFDTIPFSLMALGAGIAQAALSLLICSSFNISKKLTDSFFQLGLLVISSGVYFYYDNYTILVATMIMCGIASIVKGDHDYLFELNSTGNKCDGITFTGGICAALFGFILFTLIGLNTRFHNVYTLMAESFMRIGAISIGEGHAIIPMIFAEYKTMVEEAEVLNGYALVRILPGSLMNISAYIGVISLNLIGGIISWICILIPGFLFMLSALPHIDTIKSNTNFQFFIRGANSSAIGFILAVAAKLWIDSCYINPYTNFFIGSLSVITCCLLSEWLKIHKTIILIIGALFNLLSEIVLFYLGFRGL